MRFLEQLLKLNLPSGAYAVFGSGPLAIRGIRENYDLDVIVKKQLWDELIKQYPITNGKIKIGNIEITKSWRPCFQNRNDELIDNAEIIDNIPFVRLDYTLKWKCRDDREKDTIDCELIEKYIIKKDTEDKDI